MKYIIAYDIPSDTKRRKIAKYLEKNAIRVQKSVFFVDTNKTKIQKILKVLSKMNNKNGTIHCFSLCKSCSRRAMYLGEAKPEVWIY